jgi:hypothetical protein
MPGSGEALWDRLAITTFGICRGYGGVQSIRYAKSESLCRDEFIRLFHRFFKANKFAHK